MDWAISPPEVNSLKMYTGPGSAPMLAAITSWSHLSTTLAETAMSVGATATELAGAWTGQSAMNFMQTALKYSQWLTVMATNAQATAVQAQAALAAYETAFAATVPPPVVAANRVLLAQLVATNLLGINTPAIMMTEAQYVEMWAQDIAAMAGYQTASAQAAVLPPFSPLVSSVAPLNVLPRVIGLDIFAPGSNQATTGLAGLLNLFSGASGSAFGSLLNANAVNSVFSSGFYFGIPSAAMQSLSSLLMFGSLAQGQKQIDIQQQGLPPLPPDYPYNGEPIAPTSPQLSPAAVMGESPQVGQLSVPKSWGPENPEPIAAGDTGMFGIPMGSVGTGGNPERARYGRPVKIPVRHPWGG